MTRVVPWLFVLLIVAPVAAVQVTPPQPAPPSVQQPGCDASAFDYQVLLDRVGFSPGQIDNAFGRNTALAIRAFQETANLPSTGQPSCDTWQALRSREPADTVVSYTIADADVAGPFEPALPSDLMQQAALPSLAYRSPLEALAERFHVDADLLATGLNSGATLQAGATIRVPNVVQDMPAVSGTDAITSRTFVVEVSRERSALMLRDAEGRLVFFAPATVGSKHDPLPIGDWKVKGVSWNPRFHYNPKLFWDADPAHAKATLPAGPNSPVGIVWIAVDLPHYGIHGTPDPALVGHSYSHGCVRLTNWDAMRVAHAVRPGTEVRFR